VPDLIHAVGQPRVGLKMRELLRYAKRSKWNCYVRQITVSKSFYGKTRDGKDVYRLEVLYFL